jgi:pimeloyl-ACP methyl ester carboxylesterase
MAINLSSDFYQSLTSLLSPPGAAALLALFALVLALVLALAFVRHQQTRPKRLAQADKVSSHADLQAVLPESRFLKLPDGEIHYVQAGSGPDVVLLHGIGASVFVWRYLFPLLQARHRVTALDLPGFGQSAKPSGIEYGLDAQCSRVNDALAALGIQDALLVGSSMGGAIALWLGKTKPERIKKIAVLSPATDSSSVPSYARYVAEASSFLRFAVNRRTMRILIGAVVSRKELITDEVTNAYLAPFLDRGEAVAAFWSATALLADRRLPSELTGISQDTLILHGARDRMVSRKSIDRLLTLLPQAKFHSHPEAGHHVMEDEPVWVAKQLELFFTT